MVRLKARPAGGAIMGGGVNPNRNLTSKPYPKPKPNCNRVVDSATHSGSLFNSTLLVIEHPIIHRRVCINAEILVMGRLAEMRTPVPSP